jgi:hypothetical protein
VQAPGASARALQRGQTSGYDGLAASVENEYVTTLSVALCGASREAVSSATGEPTLQPAGERLLDAVGIEQRQQLIRAGQFSCVQGLPRAPKWS